MLDCVGRSELAEEARTVRTCFSIPLYSDRDKPDLTRTQFNNIQPGRSDILQEFKFLHSIKDLYDQLFSISMHLSYSCTITEQSQVLATMPHCKLERYWFLRQSAKTMSTPACDRRRR